MLRVVAFCVVVLAAPCSANEMCYSPSGVLGIVVATFVVTVLIGAVTVGVLWLIWRRRKGRHLSYATDKVSSHPAAFDNLYFREEEEDKGTKFTFTGSISNSKNGTKKMKTNPFSSVFNPHKKHKAMDDLCIAAEPERTVVSLKGHDFTGLGFNICGNMRDGIFVKDVLHRGPASESGKIKAGDKVISVTVSFSNIVYEDALTILSYASPYDVHLELEKRPPEKGPTTTTASEKKLASSSFTNNGQRLFHPLYRSQSIDDLTQIDGTKPQENPTIPNLNEDQPASGSLNERMISMVEDGVFRISSTRAPRRKTEAAKVKTGSLRTHRPHELLQKEINLEGKNINELEFKKRPKENKVNFSSQEINIDTTPKITQSSTSPDSLDSLEREATERCFESDGSQDSLECDNNNLEKVKARTSKHESNLNSIHSLKDIQQNGLKSKSNGSIYLPIEDLSKLNAPKKEVIEISEHELDDVMMSHRQFLARKAAASTKRNI